MTNTYTCQEMFCTVSVQELGECFKIAPELPRRGYLTLAREPAIGPVPKTRAVVARRWVVRRGHRL